MEKRLLELRNAQKKKKPTFVRQQGHSIKSLETKWRAPKGMHSKLRRKFRGKMKHPSMGYSSPSEVRFLHPSGLKPVLVHNLNDLNNLGAEQGIILSSAVGQKKRGEILKKIKELKLQVLNVKDVDKYLASIEEKMKERKAKTKAKEEKKKKAKAKSEKKKEEKSKEVTPEEKAKEEKEEKRKVLESNR